MLKPKKFSLPRQKKSRFERWSFGRAKTPLRRRNALHVSRSYTPTSRTPSKVLPAVLLIAVSLGILATAAAMAIKVGYRRDLDEALCQNGVAPEVHVVFIVDLTDGLPATCFTAFQDELKYRLERLQAYERISLYVIRQQDLYPTARGICLFSRCRPRDGSNADPITEHKGKIRKKFEAEFLKPLQKAVTSIDPDHRAKRSPILETFQALGRTPEFAGAQKREVYYFGNLLQNSESISQYKQGWEDFDSLLKHSLRVLDVKNLLNGSDVTVFLIRDPKQTTKYAQWWNAYFKYANVESYSVKRF